MGDGFFDPTGPALLPSTVVLRLLRSPRTRSRATSTNRRWRSGGVKDVVLRHRPLHVLVRTPVGDLVTDPVYMIAPGRRAVRPAPRSTAGRTFDDLPRIDVVLLATTATTTVMTDTASVGPPFDPVAIAPFGHARLLEKAGSRVSTNSTGRRRAAIPSIVVTATPRIISARSRSTGIIHCGAGP